MLFPQRRDGMRAVAARLRAERNHDGRALLHALDLTFEDTELGRIDEVVRRIDREQRRANTLEAGSRVLVPGRADLVQHIVRILRPHRVGHAFRQHFVRLRECRHLLLAKNRIASHEEDE